MLDTRDSNAGLLQCCGAVTLLHVRFATDLLGFEHTVVRLSMLSRTPAPSTHQVRLSTMIVIVAWLGGHRATTYMVTLRWDIATLAVGEAERFIKDVDKAD
jgi:hypothetical protein